MSTAGEDLAEPLLDSIESVTGTKKKREANASLFYYMRRESGLEPIQCGANEHRRRGLDRAAP
jgi:hypothetical protein